MFLEKGYGIDANWTNKKKKVSNMGGNRLNFINTICTGTISLKYLDETYSA